MELQYRLLTPGEQWPADPASLAAAISSQGHFQPDVEIAGDRLRVRDAAHGLTSMARLEPYAPETYESLLAGATYAPRMTDRDRETALPFHRQVTITTGAGPETNAASQALFHASVADGIWWLMGGFLADPYRHTLWGWRRWRGDQPLTDHATETAAHLPANPTEGGPR
ncbi:MAG TPA: hypothetical protein VKY74_00675 [Chloroflexia bacterium]|nr:hypothetical protein [Chloroflexia bacterium]